MYLCFMQQWNHEHVSQRRIGLVAVLRESSFSVRLKHSDVCWCLVYFGPSCSI